MSTWLTIPVAATGAVANPVLQAWRDMGYKIAILRNHNHDPLICDLLWDEPYAGYPKACNELIRRVAEIDPSCQWFVTGGHDIYPDPKRAAEEIAQESSDYFSGTFGIMEPTGDRWNENENGAAACEQVAAAPWIGREFARRMYQGSGAYFEGYWHFYCDQELAEVSERMGLRQFRRDLTQFNDHWMRRGGKEPDFNRAFEKTWNEATAMFAARKAANFPGHEPLEATHE